MAQFILGNRLRDKLDNWPWVQRLIWLLEAIVLGVVLLFIRLMPVAMASRAGGALMQWGPIYPTVRRMSPSMLPGATFFQG